MKKELFQHFAIILVLMAGFLNMVYMDEITYFIGFHPYGRGILLLFLPTALIAFVLAIAYGVIFNNKTEEMNNKAKVKNEKLTKDVKNNTGRVLEIKDSAYYYTGKIMVRTRNPKFVWEHKNNFPNQNSAKKLAQNITKKGFINTKYWRRSSEEF